ncbi:TPA: hypothetical protein ACVGJS_003626 [Pseudomonas aeruginosa]
MAQSLDQFVEEMKQDLEAFAAQYRKSHAENPEHYPLVLGDDNAGLWLEFFTGFVTGEDV